MSTDNRIPPEVIRLASDIRQPFCPPNWFGVGLYVHLQCANDDKEVRRRFKEYGAKPAKSLNRSAMFRWCDYEAAFAPQEE